MEKKKNGRALWSVTLRTVWRRRNASLLLLAVVLVGCFSSIALHRLTEIQEQTLADMIANTRINCILTDPQGMNGDNLNMSSNMFRKLRGEYWNESENLDDYVMDVNARTSIPLEVPGEHSICSILTFDSDPALSAVEGARITLYDGYDESILATDQRVCLIPEEEAELWPDGEVSVVRADGYAQKLTIIGTVTNGPGSVYYTPLNMSWDDEVTVITYIESCSFHIRDNMKLEESKQALYEVFVKPKLSNDLADGYGLIVQDEAYLATLDEIRSNLSMLRILLPVLMVLVGCIGFFASYMTTRSRRKEFAVMRCLGMNQRKIFSIVFFEQVVLALTGGAAGVGIGWFVDRAMEPLALAKAGIVVLVFLIGAAIAVIRVTQVNVMKLMKVED